MSNQQYSRSSGGGGVLEGDESLARMLQQQLMEEEQRMRQRQSDGSSRLSRQELDDMELARRMAQMDFEQQHQQQQQQQQRHHNPSHRSTSGGSRSGGNRDDQMERARRLQEEAFSNVSAAGASAGAARPRSMEEQLAYARSLQEQAFSNVATHSASSRQPHSRTTEESDLELAMRMQEMEELGLSSSRNGGLTRMSNDTSTPLSPGTIAAVAAAEAAETGSGLTRNSTNDRWQQEEEDARLARLMDSGGLSLRELQGRASSGSTEAAPRPSSSEPSLPVVTPGVSLPKIPRKPPSSMMQQAQPVPRAGAPKPPPLASIPPPPPVSASPMMNNSSNLPASSNNSAHSRASLPPPRNAYPPTTATVPGRIPAAATFPPAVVHADPPGIAIPNEAAFLGVPNPKEKQKRRGLFGFFRGSNTTSDQTIASNQSRQSTRSAPPRASKKAARSSQNNNNNRLPPAGVPPIPMAVPPPPPDATRTLSGPLPHSVSVSQNIRHNETTAQRKGAFATCSNCKKLSPNLIVALDKKYHPDCLRCVACYQVIDATQPFAFITDNEGEKQPLHRRCYAGLYGVKCAVCKQTIPASEDGKVSFVKHPFFDTEQMCPKHATNPGRRCTGCHRFEPEDEPFADLNDASRCVCLACCRTVIVDSTEATILWNKVIDFYEKLGLPIWKDMREVPILIVGYDALNNQIARAGGSHGNSTQIMTRGLCLTEHESGRKIKLSRLRYNKNNFSFEACDAELKGFTFFQVPDANKVNPDASVTAVLCLSGLPSDLVASVLAHEATHAWIKLHPRFDIANPIPPQVEEGCAQLIALLFLNDGLEPASRETLDVYGPTDEKLRQYFKFSIETDDNEIYGDGYRKAAAAYADIGIEALMSHVVLYQDFPRT